MQSASTSRRRVDDRDATEDQTVGIVPGFLTDSDCDLLARWALKQYGGGRLRPNPAGPHRYYNSLKFLKPVPQKIAAIRRRVVSLLSLEGVPEEPTMGSLIGINREGGFVHRHRDFAPEGWNQLRVNVLVSVPEAGGVPIISDREHGLTLGDLWCFLANRCFHASTPVQGSRPRVLLSFGFAVPESYPITLRVGRYQAGRRRSSANRGKR